MVIGVPAEMMAMKCEVGFNFCGARVWGSETWRIGV